MSRGREVELIVSGKVRVKPEKREAAIEAALHMAEASRNDPGCREFRIFSDLADPYTFFMFEAWESVDAMTRHFQTEHMAEFQTQLKKVAVGYPEIKRYVVAA